jgi:hypothetical protein
MCSLGESGFRSAEESVGLGFILDLYPQQNLTAR